MHTSWLTTLQAADLRAVPDVQIHGTLFQCRCEIRVPRNKVEESASYHPAAKAPLRTAYTAAKSNPLCMRLHVYTGHSCTVDPQNGHAHPVIT